jgi:hypothetical protein
MEAGRQAMGSERKNRDRRGWAAAASSLFGQSFELVLVAVAAELVILDQWYTTESVALR